MKSIDHNPTATYQQALTATLAQFTELSKTFKLFLADRDDITPVDCMVVIGDAEKLIDAVQTLKQALKDRISVQGGAQ